MINVFEPSAQLFLEAWTQKNGGQPSHIVIIIVRLLEECIYAATGRQINVAKFLEIKDRRAALEKFTREYHKVIMPIYDEEG